MQTESHWCTFNSFKTLIIKLAAYAVITMLAQGLDPDTQYWIVVLDCYAVRKSEDFLTWAKETYPRMILLDLYIFAGCTRTRMVRRGCQLMGNPNGYNQYEPKRRTAAQSRTDVACALF